jgi:uncharacterized membrane protein
VNQSNNKQKQQQEQEHKQEDCCFFCLLLMLILIVIKISFFAQISKSADLNCQKIWACMFLLLLSKTKGEKLF